MSKTQKGKIPLSKSGVFFQGKTIVKGDFVEHKEIHGYEVHGNQNIGGDSISINGDGNIIGNGNVSQIIKTGVDNVLLAKHFSQLSKKIDSIQRLSPHQKESANSTLLELEKEVKKGDDTNAEKITPWLKMLKKTVPEIVGGLLEVLVHPLVGKMVEVVAKAILKD